MQILSQKKKYLSRDLDLHDQRGQAALISVFFFISIMLGIASGFTSLALNQERIVRTDVNGKQSYFLAEAGAEDATYRIRTGLSIGTEETITLDGSSAVTSITSLLSGGRQIVTTADVKGHIRNVSTSLVIGHQIDFFYGAQAGEGGIEMGGNSSIEGAEGTLGNVYSNGSIIGENGATITGDVIVSGGLTEDVSSEVCNADQVVGRFDPEVDLTQSFVPSVSGTLPQINLYIKKVGSPSDRDVIIAADDGGVPSTSELAKGKLTSSLVGSDYGWIDVDFSSPTTVVAGVTYWIILDAKKDANKYWIWCKDSLEGYSLGVSRYSKDWKSKPWVLETGDLSFKINIGAGNTVIDNIDVGLTARAHTINDSTVGVDAYYQTISNTDVTGSLFPGSEDPVISSLPISDANINDWKKEAGCGSEPPQAACEHVGDYIVDTNTTIGPLVITGDLLLSSTNKTLTIDGTVYVQGNIDVDNGSTIKCSSGYGIGSCIIITDGWLHVKNNSNFDGSGNEGSYIMILSTLACIGAPSVGCGHHDGAMDIHNNAGGAIFYASAGMINLHNGVDVTEVTAYKLRLDNNASITYESGLTNALFSAGPAASFNVSDWKEVE